MAEKLEELVIEIRAESKKLLAGMNNAVQAVQNSSGKMSKTFENLEKKSSSTFSKISRGIEQFCKTTS